MIKIEWYSIATHILDEIFGYFELNESWKKAEGEEKEIWYTELYIEDGLETERMNGNKRK